mmetsp:Transcript_42762/g.114773  ORF Transcript_42762/g.114773 Transcript_42762/m.114773 type:complete len:170 (+) Transcript_42762:1191-1700(+)
MAASESTTASPQAHGLAGDMGTHVAGFVADRADDARRLADLDALLEVHRRLEDDYVLNAILELCRQELTRGYEGLDVSIQAVEEVAHLDLDGASIRACIEPLTTLGFTVLGYPDDDDDGMPISITFPWMPPPSGVTRPATLHLGKANAPWRLFINPVAWDQSSAYARGR